MDTDLQHCKLLPILANLFVLHVFEFKRQMLVVIGNFNPLVVSAVDLFRFVSRDEYFFEGL
jgi:hypothetical protein